MSFRVIVFETDGHLHFYSQSFEDSELPENAKTFVRTLEGHISRDLLGTR